MVRPLILMARPPLSGTLTVGQILGISNQSPAGNISAGRPAWQRRRHGGLDEVHLNAIVKLELGKYAVNPKPVEIPTARGS